MKLIKYGMKQWSINCIPFSLFSNRRINIIYLEIIFFKKYQKSFSFSIPKGSLMANSVYAYDTKIKNICIYKLLYHYCYVNMKHQCHRMMKLYKALIWSKQLIY